MLPTLVEMLLGGEHHELGVTFRNVMLISSLLTNCESWYDVTIANIVKVEKVNKQMVRGILNAPIMTPKALLYLELGCLPIRYIIKSRRLMFLHSILSQSEDSLLMKFCNVQMENSNKTERDLKELEICLETEDIKNMSKNKFKSHINNKIECAALKYKKSTFSSQKTYS